MNPVLENSEKVAGSCEADKKVAWVAMIQVCLDLDNFLAEVVHEMRHYADPDDSVAVAHDSQMAEKGGLAGPLVQAAAAKKEASCFEVLLWAGP